MNDDNIKFIKVATSLVVVLLTGVLLSVVYILFKPPIVTKATVDALVESARMTEQYMRELRDYAAANRLNVNKDNDLLKGLKEKNSGEYNDLYEKYGIVGYEQTKSDIPIAGVDRDNRVRSENNDK